MMKRYIQLSLGIALLAAIGAYAFISHDAKAVVTANVWVTPGGGNTCVRQSTAVDFASAPSNAKCNSFQGAFNAMQSNDTALVRTGTYDGDVKNDSVVTKSVTIKVDAGQTATASYCSYYGINGLTVDGTGGANGQGLVCSGGTGISENGSPSITNFTFKGAKLGGMFWATHCYNTLVSQVEITNVQYDDGIQVSSYSSPGSTEACHGLTFDRMDIHDLVGRCGVDHQDGIQIRAGSNVTMQNSKIHDLPNCGSQGWFPNPRGDIDSTGRNINLINTAIWDINGTAMNMGEFLNGRIAYNTIDGAMNSCVGVGDPYPECMNTQTTIVGNLFNTSCNNLTRYRWQYDVWKNNAQTNSCGATGDTIISDWDSLFVNAAGDDYHLKSTAQVRDAGENDYCTRPTVAFTDVSVNNVNVNSIDADGGSRPIGGACDPGAYEYGSGGGSAKPGDVNGDNVVNGSDVSLLITDFLKAVGQASYSAEDTNSDGVVNGADLSSVISHFGS